MTDPRKPIFDAIRSMKPEVFNDAGNILALDNLLDAFGIPRSERPSMIVSQKGIDLLHEFEGFAKMRPDGLVEAYPDPATGGAPWTIGYGSTTDENGNPIQPGTVWTKERAEKKFQQDIHDFANKVNQLIRDIPTTQNQFDAMVSLAYNIGIGNFRRSTLLKRHKEGNYGAAANQFRVWNRAAGRVLPGLTRRREAEAALYQGQR